MGVVGLTGKNVYTTFEGAGVGCTGAGVGCTGARDGWTGDGVGLTGDGVGSGSLRNRCTRCLDGSCNRDAKLYRNAGSGRNSSCVDRFHNNDQAIVFLVDNWNCVPIVHAEFGEKLDF